MPDSDTPDTPRYSIIIPEETRARAADYLDALRCGANQPGARLQNRLQAADLHMFGAEDLLAALLDTKQPRIFAEMAVVGNGSDWNLTELGLLGDISVAVPVTIFDDGNHHNPAPHDPPFPGTLVFTPGALLRNGLSHAPADWHEVTMPDGQFSEECYFGLHQRRLLPVFRYINERAGTPRSAFITVPGLGCGQFAGPFQGQLGRKLQSVLERLLTKYGNSFPNIRAVYFDPYDECANVRTETHGISFMVRPLRIAGNRTKSQLCRPVYYAERIDDFTRCALFSIVAWDHVSWPGNDFFGGIRATDDGVKAAATNSMSVLTRIEGHYEAASGRYQPPSPYATWGELVEDETRKPAIRLWRHHAVWRPDNAA